MWVTTKEAAKILNKSDRTIQRMVKQRKLESKEIPGIGRGGVTLYVKVSKINEKTNDKLTNDKISKISEKKSSKINEKSAKNDEIPHKDLRHTTYDTFETVQSVEKQGSYKTQEPTTYDTLPISENRQLSELQEVKKTNDIAQGGVQQGVQIDVVSPKSLNISEIDNSFDWVSLDQGVQLSEVSRRTIFNRIEKRQIETLKVPDPACGQRTFLRVRDISPLVEMKWHEIQASKMDDHLPVEIQKEKKKFEIGRKEDRDIAWARLSVIKEFYHIHELAKKAGKRKGEADRIFKNKMEDREILSSELRVLDEQTIGLSTIKRWIKSWKDSGNLKYPVTLLPMKKGKVGRKRIKADDIRATVKTLASDDVNLPSTIIYRMILETYHFTEETCPMRPSTIYSLVRKYRKDKLMMNARKGKESYKNNIKPHIHRINDCEPGDIWESDGHRMNNICYNPFLFQDGYNPIIRPILMAWFDVATGLVTGWALYYSETFHVMVTSFADGLKNWGPPKMVRMDNGSAFKNAYTAVEYFAFKKNKTKTSAQKTALELHRNGFKGFFQECGVQKVQWVIPGNAESKQIEPAWRYMLAEFEKTTSLYMGENIGSRPEKFKGMSSKKLMKQYKNEILTWNEYCRALEYAINEYNNRQRDILKTVDGKSLSPIQMYLQFPENIRKQSQAEIDRTCRDMFPEQRTVNQNEINIMGMYYRHPLLSTYLGRKVNVYYNEKNLETVQLGSLDGEIWTQPAKRIIPSCHMNPDQFQKAIQANNHYHKEVLATYANIKAKDDKLSIEQKNLISDATVDDMLIESEKKQELIKHNQQPKLSSRFTIKNMKKYSSDLPEETEKPKEKKPLSPFLALSKKVNG